MHRVSRARLTFPLDLSVPRWHLRNTCFVLAIHVHGEGNELISMSVACFWYEKGLDAGAVWRSCLCGVRPNYLAVVNV